MRLLLLTICFFYGFTLTPAFAEGSLSTHFVLTKHAPWTDIIPNTYQAALPGELTYSQLGINAINIWQANQEMATVGSDDVPYSRLNMSLANSWHNIRYDLAYVYQDVGAGEQLNLSEFHASLAWSFLSVGIGKKTPLQQIKDLDNDLTKDTYIQANLTFEVLQELKLGLHFGSLDKHQGKDQQDYNFSLSKNGLRFVVSKVDDISQDNEYRVIVSYSREVHF
jgi:hypothetical protein